MFENMIEPDEDPENYQYPAGVEDDVDKQRWKPRLVGENSKATYFKMRAYYTTYNGDPSCPQIRITPPSRPNIPSISEATR